MKSLLPITFLVFFVSGLQIKNQDVSSLIHQKLDSAQVKGFLIRKGVHNKFLNVIENFYEEREYKPVWLEDKSSEIYLHYLSQAKKEGLEPDDYLFSNLQNYENLRKPTASQKADQDLLTTCSFMLYVSHLLYGKVNPTIIDPSWGIERDTQGLEINLLELAANGEAGRAMEEAIPDCIDYKLLKSALAKYRLLEQNGGWPKIDLNESLKIGDTSQQVVSVRKRLSKEGILTDTSTLDSSIFDVHLENAVKTFQHLNSIEPDGVVGPATLSKLNITVEDKIDLIRINMERLRWLPHRIQNCDYFIRVNIAAFELDLFDEGKRQLNMNIIVGRPYRKTPVFEKVMEFIVLNPYWTVPPGIVTNDVMPAIRKDPGYLKRKGIKAYLGEKEVNPSTIDWGKVDNSGVPYWFRADPGPLNPLGKIKFMFPNKYNVYIHDTPDKELFEETVPAFSSGCIRISKPLELAGYLLKSQNISIDSLHERLNTAKSDTILLQKPIDVQILYMTTWMDEHGDVHFSSDPYKRDQNLKNVFIKGNLKEEYPEKN